MAIDARFAIDLYQVLSRDSQENLLFSPVSVAFTLGMAHLGARGLSREQLERGLRWDASQGDLQERLAALAVSLQETQSLPQEVQETWKNSQSLGILQIANSLWAVAGLEMQPEFQSRIQQNYAGKLFTTDFSDSVAAAAQINRWVADNTAQRIPTIVAPGQLSPQAALLLINAVYFKMRWQEPFKPKDSYPAPFFTIENKPLKVPTMHIKEHLRYAAIGEQCQVVELPYMGRRLAMVIILPRRGTFRQFSSELSYDGLATMLSALDSRTVKLALPRFKFERSFALKKALQALGVVEPFDAKAADFGEIAPVIARAELPFWIDEVLHKTFIAVDEHGTEAAAVTVLYAGATSEPATPVEMKVDSPFLFAIRDTTSGALLFMGHVLAPCSE